MSNNIVHVSGIDSVSSFYGDIEGGCSRLFSCEFKRACNVFIAMAGFLAGASFGGVVTASDSKIETWVTNVTVGAVLGMVLFLLVDGLSRLCRSPNKYLNDGTHKYKIDLSSIKSNASEDDSAERVLTEEEIRKVYQLLPHAVNAMKELKEEWKNLDNKGSQIYSCERELDDSKYSSIRSSYMHKFFLMYQNAEIAKKKMTHFLNCLINKLKRRDNLKFMIGNQCGVNKQHIVLPRDFFKSKESKESDESDIDASKVTELIRVFAFNLAHTLYKDRIKPEEPPVQRV